MSHGNHSYFPHLEFQTSVYLCTLRVMDTAAGHYSFIVLDPHHYHVMAVIYGINSEASLHTLYKVLISTTHGLVTHIYSKRLTVTHRRSSVTCPGCAAAAVRPTPTLSLGQTVVISAFL